jgi:predicted methyltransferase
VRFGLDDRACPPHEEAMRSIAISLAASFLLACGGAATSTAPAATPEPAPAAVHAHVATVTPTAPVLAAVEAADRTEEDRAIDQGRRPAEVLSFFRIGPDQRVADLFAGRGYTTELLARTVGAGGLVLAQNDTMILDRFARAPLAERLARLGMSNVVAVERAFDAPLPDDAHDLDAVIFVLSYHDTVWMGTDRAAMNRAVFTALRPGGVYGIVDHAAAEGHGVADVQTLHRIEESVVVDEVLAAGFVLEEELDLLRNPGDAHDWNDSPSAAGDRRGTSDRFVLRFVRP